MALCQWTLQVACCNWRQAGCFKNGQSHLYIRCLHSENQIAVALQMTGLRSMPAPARGSAGFAARFMFVIIGTAREMMTLIWNSPNLRNRGKQIRILVALAVLLTGAGTTAAQEEWRAQLIENHSYPVEIVADTRRSAPNGLPDGRVATYSGNGDIASAWYAAPTTRYRHGILGDAVEAAVLKVKTPGGATLSFALPAAQVYEDRYPRLADLDGDGKIEVVTIRSSVSMGASVAVYGLAAGALVERASTGFIGRANRWLNIAGIASFNGAGGKQIAFVQTPHIGGTLFIYKFAKGALHRAGSLHGFSNHVIGSREMRLSAVADINGGGLLDLALPADDRSILRIVGFGNNGLTERAAAQLPARIDKAIAVEGSGQDLRFIVGLENGEVYAVYR